jgi:hypothetical protein
MLNLDLALLQVEVILPHGQTIVCLPLVVLLDYVEMLLYLNRLFLMQRKHHNLLLVVLVLLVLHQEIGI